MGIRLDWEIEAEQDRIRGTGEDPQAQQERRAARFRLVMLTTGVILAFAALAVAVLLRLETVDSIIEQDLRDTVEAEVTAIRIGDLASFAAVQRSANNDWILAQTGAFQEYQRLKIESDLQVTGRILNLEIDRSRARVQVEEIINSTPFSRVWFYWRYEDGTDQGWRHVPPDITFWGDAQAYIGQGIQVDYRQVDQPLAAAVGLTLEEWLTQACKALQCPERPAMRVTIIPDDGLVISWSAADPWLLQIPSPALRGARVDMPFDPAMRIEVANLLADQLISALSNNMQPVYPADAYYLRQAVESWLIGSLVEMNTNAHVITSLTARTDPTVIGTLIRTMQPTSSVSVLAQAARAPSLDSLNLDWRDFFTWRLALETELINARDESSFLMLYDTRDEQVRNLAYARYSQATSPGQRLVTAIVQDVDSAGGSVLRATVQSSDSIEDVVFRLVDGTWKRAS